MLGRRPVRGGRRRLQGSGSSVAAASLGLPLLQLDRRCVLVMPALGSRPPCLHAPRRAHLWEEEALYYDNERQSEGKLCCPSAAPGCTRLSQLLTRRCVTYGGGKDAREGGRPLLFLSVPSLPPLTGACWASGPSSLPPNAVATERACAATGRAAVPPGPGLALSSGPIAAHNEGDPHCVTPPCGRDIRDTR